MPERIHGESNYFDKLERLMKVLREECAWDRAQTPSSLRTYLLEETHEVLEAIDVAAQLDDWAALREELGDLLLQIAFHAAIADERRQFSLADVFDGLIEKMIYRHPHVFSDAEPDDLKEQWERLKAAERSDRTSLMDGIPPLPGLARAQKQQKRAARVGFDWSRDADVIAKIEEEVEELAEEVGRGAPERHRLEEEFGDVLFTLVNLGRRLDLDAELCLMRSNRKFDRRFRAMERLAGERGMRLEALDAGALETLYTEAKARAECGDEEESA